MRLLEKVHDPKFMAKVHGSGWWIWLLLALVTMATPLRNQVWWISFMSVYALALAHLAGYSAARGEIRTKEKNSNGDSYQEKESRQTAQDSQGQEGEEHPRVQTSEDEEVQEPHDAQASELRPQRAQVEQGSQEEVELCEVTGLDPSGHVLTCDLKKHRGDTHAMCAADGTIAIEWGHFHG